MSIKILICLSDKTEPPPGTQRIGKDAPDGKDEHDQRKEPFDAGTIEIAKTERECGNPYAHECGKTYVPVHKDRGDSGGALPCNSVKVVSFHCITPDDAGEEGIEKRSDQVKGKKPPQSESSWQ